MIVNKLNYKLEHKRELFCNEIEDKVTLTLYIFFWVFPRHQIVVGRRFGILYQFHLQRLGVQSHCTPSLWRWNWYRVPKRWTTTIWRRGNTQKKIYNIQIMAKVW